MTLTPIVEYAAGVACANCWGVAEAFGDVPTPLRITITGAGFAGADLPLNDTFIAEQMGGSPCIWSFDTGIVYGSWQSGAANAFFQMGLTGGPASFQTVEAKCALLSVLGAESVSISATDPVTPEHKIAYEQNFSPNKPTYAMNLGSADTDEVLVMAKRSDRVKLHVRFVPDY